MPAILVVEDEAHIKRVLAMWLGRHGFDVFEASNGEAALDILERESVDLVVTDMNMPVVNGLELIEAVRERHGMGLPIMLLSARCDQTQLANRIKPYGVRLYPKPFVPSRLVADISALLAVESERSDGR